MILRNYRAGDTETIPNKKNDKKKYRNREIPGDENTIKKIKRSEHG